MNKRPSPVRFGLGALALSSALAGCGGGAAIVGGPFPGDPANFAYELGGAKVELKNGQATEALPAKPDAENPLNSHADDHLDTDLTGVRFDGDFDGDASTDCAVVITRDAGPVKAHYLAVIQNLAGGLKATTLELGKNVLVKGITGDAKSGLAVRVLVRPEDAPEDTPPTVEATKKFKLKDGKLVSSK